MKDAENVYTCQECGGCGYTVTVDVDEGVTPFTIRCRASGDALHCQGMAVSSFYPAGPRPDHIPAPAWEWYKPDVREISRIRNKGELQHIAMGGLLLRKRQEHATERNGGERGGSR